MSRMPLFAALLRRELGSSAALQRLVLVTAVSLLCGWLAAGIEPVRPGGRPGSLERTLDVFESLAAFLVGTITALRLIATRHEDAREGWLPQLLAAGLRRDAYAAWVTAALVIAAWTDYGIALGVFSLAHAVVDGPAPLGRMLDTVPFALPWLACTVTLAAACAVALRDRARARFAFGTLLLLPYALMLAGGYLNGDRGAPAALVHAVGVVSPVWTAPLTLTGAGYLLLNVGVALSVVLLLAARNVERSR